MGTPNRYIKAFTLFELLTVVSILAVILAMAVPLMRNQTADGRITESINLLMSTMRTARSEAIARFEINIVVCARGTGSSCGTNWSAGWMIFVDSNRDDSRDDDEEILRLVTLPEQDLWITLLGGKAGKIIFVDDGMSQPASVVVCDNRGNTQAKAVVINGAGHARIARDDDDPEDGIVNLHNTENAFCDSTIEEE